MTTNLPDSQNYISSLLSTSINIDADVYDQVFSFFSSKTSSLAAAQQLTQSVLTLTYNNKLNPLDLLQQFQKNPNNSDVKTLLISFFNNIKGSTSKLGYKKVTSVSLKFGGQFYVVGDTLSVDPNNIGGSGSGATADIVISGGKVTSVTLTFGGNFYVVGDILSASSSTIGNSGSGFSIPVATISNATGRSWLGDNYDPVLFYGAMREALIFMKGEQDMVQYYEQKYQEALQQLNRLGTGLERGDAYRDGQAKIKVSA